MINEKHSFTKVSGWIVLYFNLKMLVRSLQLRCGEFKWCKQMSILWGHSQSILSSSWWKLNREFLKKTSSDWYEKYYGPYLLIIGTIRKYHTIMQVPPGSVPVNSSFQLLKLSARHSLFTITDCIFLFSPDLNSWSPNPRTLKLPSLAFNYT